MGEKKKKVVEKTVHFYLSKTTNQAIFSLIIHGITLKFMK